MEITISPELKATVPDFKIGIIHYHNIEVSDSPQMVKGRLRLFQEKLYFDLLEKQLTDFDGIKEWRDIFKKVGTDPSRYRPSAEALYRRIKKQQYIETIHSAADLNNFFSLQYEIPLGIYDLDKLKGDISITIGTDEDEYLGINERTIHMEKKILTKDAVGPFGSPFVDSKRSAVTLGTKNAIQLIYLKPNMNVDQAEKLVKSLQDMFVSIHGGTAAYSVIS